VASPLCCARVLEEDSIDVECIKFAGTVAIDRFTDTTDEFAQLRVVVVRDHRARRPSFRLAGHESEATHRLVSRSGRARRPVLRIAGSARASAVDGGHVGLVVPFSRGRLECVEPLKLLGGEPDVRGCRVLLDAGDATGARDGSDVLATGQ
jgi:hypothetical protein